MMLSPGREKLLGKEQRNIRKTRKVTKLVTVVTLNFAICWLPAHLFTVLMMFIDIQDLPNNIYAALSFFKLFAHTLSYLTPILNPIAYGYYNESFRQPLKHLFKRTHSGHTHLSQSTNCQIALNTRTSTTIRNNTTATYRD